MIAGLEEPTEGEIAIDGEVVNGVDPRDRDVAMVFQSYALYPNMSVYENIRFPLRMRGVPKAEHRERVLKVAAMVELGDLLDRKPAHLSGGQRQRVAIGRAIVREPSVFLFDEPLSNLDAALRGQMRVELAELHRQLGTTMVYVTHDQVEAMTMAERIVVLNGGRVEQVGAPMDLYRSPATRFVAGFIGQPPMNLLQAKVDRADAGRVVATIGPDQRIEAAVDGRSLAEGEAISIGIRPDDMALVAQGGIPVRLSVLERLGPQTVVHARTDSGAVLSAVVAGDTDLAPGDRVAVLALPDKVHVFNSSGQALPRAPRPAL